jgi:hypothetical protein
MALSGNSFSGGSVPFTGMNYLTSSDIIEMHAKAKIDVNPRVFGRYGKEKLGILPFIEEFGQKEAASSSVFSHYEQDFTRDIIKCVANLSAGTPNSAHDIEVASASYDTYPDTGDSFYPNYAVGGSLQFPVREADVVVIAGVEAIVIGVDEGTKKFTAVPTVLGESIPAVTTSTEIYISGRARAERSTGPKGRDTRLIKYENFIQTIDEAYSVSGAALGQSGLVQGFAGTDKWYATGILNTRTNFDALCELTLLTGKKISNNTNGSIANTFKTEGIIPFIQNYGNVVQYGSAANAMDLSDLDNMIADLKKFYGSDSYMLLESHPFSVQLDDALRGLVDAGGVVYDQKMLDLGFGAVRRSGINIYRKSLQGFSDPRTLGSKDSLFTKSAIMIPTGTATSFDYNGGQMVEKPTMMLKYLDVDGEDMGYKEIVTGGAGIANTNNTDEMVITMRKRMGIELNGANLMGYFEGSDPTP